MVTISFSVAKLKFISPFKYTLSRVFVKSPTIGPRVADPGCRPVFCKHLYTTPSHCATNRYQTPPAHNPDKSRFVDCTHKLYAGTDDLFGLMKTTRHTFCQCHSSLQIPRQTQSRNKMVQGNFPSKVIVLRCRAESTSSYSELALNRDFWLFVD